MLPSSRCRSRGRELGGQRHPAATGIGGFTERRRPAEAGAQLEKIMKHAKSLIAVLSATLLLSACGTVSGTAIGAAAGAGVGHAVSDGSVLGTVGGAAAGGVIGHEVGKRNAQ